MRLTKMEKETIIRFDDESDKATIYTCNRAWQTKMKKLATKNKKFKLIEKDEISVTYEFPKNLITVRSKKVERNLTEKEKKKIGEMLNKGKAAECKK